MPINLSAAEAFERVVAAIQAAGATFTWHAPPHSAKFELQHRDRKYLGGVKVKYYGELTVSEVSPTSALVGLDLKVDWNSMVPVLGSAAVLAIVFVMFVNTMLVGYLFMLVLGLMGYFAWAFASKVPSDYRDQFMEGLPRATGPMMAGAGAPPPAPPGPGGAQQSAGWADRLKQMGGSLSSAASSSPAGGLIGRLGDKMKAPPASAPPVAPEATPPAAGGPTTTAADRIKQLKELLDAGAITQAEYDAKKAALLDEL